MAVSLQIKLPAASDSSWRPVNEWDRNRLGKLKQYVEAGRPVWWDRKYFADPVFRDSIPKRHLFVSRALGDDPDRWYDTVWTAVCGYSFKPVEILGGLPRFTTSAPAVAERCRRCNAMYPDLRRQAREAGAAKGPS